MPCHCDVKRQVGSESSEGTLGCGGRKRSGAGDLASVRRSEGGATLGACRATSWPPVLNSSAAMGKR